MKSNVDSGIFKAIQKAAIAAYSTSEAELASVISIYQNRRDIIVKGLQSLGWPIQPPQATLYVWVPVPPEYSSTEFVTLLLDKCCILVQPDNGYSAAGEGFFRIALTVSDERMHEAIQRLKDASIRYEGLGASSGLERRDKSPSLQEFIEQLFIARPPGARMCRE